MKIYTILFIILLPWPCEGQGVFQSQAKDFPVKIYLFEDGNYEIRNPESKNRIISEGVWKKNNDSLKLVAYHHSLDGIDSLAKVSMAKHDDDEFSVKIFMYIGKFESERDLLKNFPIKIALFHPGGMSVEEFPEYSEYYTNDFSQIDSIKILNFLGLPEWTIITNGNNEIEIGFEMSLFFKLTILYDTNLDLNHLTWLYSEEKLILTKTGDTFIRLE